MVDDFNPSGDWFADAPGGDINLDQLFPDPNGDGAQPTSTAPPAAPQGQQEDFFLKTPTGTVYKTADDAVNGITHKDNLIASLRDFAIKQTGFDPVTQKQVGQPQRAQRAPEPAPERNQNVAYTQSPQQFWDDLVAAAQNKDYDAYLRIQGQLVDEKIAPYAPMLANFARVTAVENLGNQYPEFRKFYGSDKYRQTLDAIPLLKQAIETAESNPQISGQLDQLYKTAYLAGQGLRLTEVPTEEPPRAATPQAPQHPTLTSTQIPPPHEERRPQFDPNTREGRLEQRKQVIADQINKGVLDIKF